MKTVSSAEAVLYGALAMVISLRVEVKDAGGTWRDMSTYHGFDSVLSVVIDSKVDDPLSTADVVLTKRMDGFNLSPFMLASASNVGMVLGGAYSPALWLNRELRVSYAMHAEGETPAAWTVLWHGRIDTLDAAGESVRLRCRDLGGTLTTAWVKREYVYGYAEVSGVAVRCRYFAPNDDTYVLNEYVLPKGKLNGHFYKVTSLGSSPNTSGTKEPTTWPLSGTVVSGDITFTYQGAVTTTGVPLEEALQNVLDDFGGGVSLYTPTSPSTNVNAFVLPKGPLLEAVRNLALLTIGWDVRYLWDSGTSAFRLTLSTPNRTSPSVARTFTAEGYTSVDQFSVDLQDIRNHWQGVYSNASDLWPDGTAKRVTVTRTDTGSITLYGEQFAGLQEDSVSPIDSQAEMEALLDNALMDTKDPTVEGKFKFADGFPHVELNDYYTFSANGLEHDADISVAVTGYHHTFQDGKLETTMAVRGKPTLGAKRWIEASTWARPDLQHKLEMIDQLAGVTLSTEPIPGGARITAALGGVPVNSVGLEYEWHLDDAPIDGDVTTATIVGISKDNQLTLGDLVPGKPYYLAVVPRIRNATRVARGLPSEEVTFTAGRANAAHLGTDVDWGRKPINGGFETWNETGTVPDHWEIPSGETWGGSFVRESGSGGRGGSQWVKQALNFFAAGGLHTKGYFEVAGDQNYAVGWSLYIVSGTAGTTLLKVEWYDHAQALISTSTIDTVAYNEFATATWRERQARVAAPATARFGRIVIQNGTAGDAVFRIDEVWLRDIGEQWHSVGGTGEPAFQNSWVNFGGTAPTAQFRKDSSGRVYVRGAVKSGTVGTAVFTLPVGYRPPNSYSFSNVNAAGSAGRSTVNSTGIYTIDVGSNAWTYIDTSFETW